MKVGILALQGDIEEHYQVTKQAAKELDLALDIVLVKDPEDLDGVQGLILPGGESTTMTAIARKKHLPEAIKEKIHDGMKTFATCAGAILLAKNVKRKLNDPPKPGLIGVSDITVIRNAYGRQKESFETTINVEAIGEVKAAFIRAPIIESVTGNVKILASFDNTPVLVKDDANLISTFHPEITGDTTLHKYFLQSLQ